jgi:hypothetical protein
MNIFYMYIIMELKLYKSVHGPINYLNYKLQTIYNIIIIICTLRLQSHVFKELKMIIFSNYKILYYYVKKKI